MIRGLVVGRFQPFHLGHQSGLIKALGEVDEMVVVVASSGRSFEPDNPLTSGERIEMISRALKDAKIFNKCYIVPVSNIEDHSLWVSKVEVSCPDFDEVYSNNPLVRELFEEKYIVNPLYSGYGSIESKKIRELLVKDKSINKLVPPAIITYLEKFKINERLQNISYREVKK